jgi:hypothetical protein
MRKMMEELRKETVNRLAESIQDGAASDAVVDVDIHSESFSYFLEHEEGFMCSSGHVNPPVCCQLCATEANRKLVQNHYGQRNN